MTQEDVRQILIELGGKATLERISTQTKQRFPDRTLNTYIGQVLDQLEKKKLVTEVENDTWELTQKGKETSLSGVELSEVSTEVDQSALNEHGLEVTNIVGTIQANQEFNLNILAQCLPNAEYHPETSPFLLYRPIESSTLLVPTNGVISIVGAKTITQIKQSADAFFNELDKLGIEVDSSPDDILIQNIVLKGDFCIELDLDVLSVGIGLENCEYNPEKFPGIIFRNKRGATVLVFRTGKYLITGAKSYASAFQVAVDIHRKLQSLGINIKTDFY